MTIVDEGGVVSRSGKRKSKASAQPEGEFVPEATPQSEPENPAPEEAPPAQADSSLPPDAPATEPEPTPAKREKKAKKPAGEITLADLTERFAKMMEGAGNSPSTVSSYGMELRLACRELGAETPIATLTPSRVGKYFACAAVTKLKSGRDKSQLSIDKTRRVLRLALVWAAEKKWIEAAPIPASKS